MLVRTDNTVIGTDGEGNNASQKGNLISGNSFGVLIFGPGNDGNRVAGNLIGTNADGTSRLGNTGHGVLIAEGACSNIIGTNGDGHGDAAEFNSAVVAYKNWLAPSFGHEVTKGRAEYYFNQVKSFLHAIIIYIFAFVLAGAALLLPAPVPGHPAAR